MTREEAITTLSFLRSEYNCFDEGRERYHALSMAIEALSREPCEDCVSRQTAIDAIEAREANEFGKYMEYNVAFNDGLHSAVFALEELPSAEQLK